MNTSGYALGWICSGQKFEKVAHQHTDHARNRNAGSSMN